MSKSKKNVVAPEEIFESHGADAARLFVLSDSPPERDVQWTASGLEGSWRLVNRIWSEFEAHPLGHNLDADMVDADRAAELHRITHRAIKAVGEAIEGFRFNSAIARIYEFLNQLKGFPVEAVGPAVLGARNEALSALARLIAPFAPHLAEACWERLGNEGMVVEAEWPVYDPELAAENERVLPVQVNGKRRGEIRVAIGVSPAEVEAVALADPEVRRHLEGLSVRKVIVVQDRIVNIVAG
jgi:leucyl-tRNA synthetase